MSWCDKLASVPTVGFRLTNHFAPIDVILNLLSPILDRVPEDQTKNVAVEQSTTHFSTSFVLNDGFKYAVSEAQISVAFQHRMADVDEEAEARTKERAVRLRTWQQLYPGSWRARQGKPKPGRGNPSRRK